MRKTNVFKTYLTLFLSFFKIGLFTFGGGYAMIPLIQREASEKRDWINQNEILDVIAIAESTPGPIAINAATYIGFKVGKFWGSFFATLGIVLPSFGIILLISLFYQQFMELAFISAIFKGLRIGVIILLFRAFIKLSKSFKFNLFNIILLLIVLGVNITLAILNVRFNYTSMIMIFTGMLLGIIFCKPKKGENV